MCGGPVKVAAMVNILKLLFMVTYAHLNDAGIHARCVSPLEDKFEKYCFNAQTSNGLPVVMFPRADRAKRNLDKIMPLETINMIEGIM